MEIYRAEIIQEMHIFLFADAEGDLVFADRVSRIGEHYSRWLSIVIETAPFHGFKWTSMHNLLWI